MHLHYDEAGSHQGMPVVMLHGGGPGASGMSNFKNNLPAFAGHFRTLVVDQPGYGKSDKPEVRGNYFTFAAAALKDLLGELGIDQAHLVGNSLGGAVCVKVAAARPELVRTLSLISPALPDLRPRLDLVRFPVIGLPRVGPRLIRQYQATQPPERRVAAVIATCFSTIARTLPPSGWA